MQSLNLFSMRALPSLWWVGVGCLAMLSVLGAAAAARATDYYVSPTGSDDNPGTASLPFLSPAKVNTLPLKPGDSVLFASGATFTGGLAFGENVVGTRDKPIVIGSAGSERATILSPGQTAISAVGGGITIRDLVLKGAATAPDKRNGIAFLTSDPTGKKYSDILIQNVEVTGFGGDAISIGSAGNAKSGYENVRITLANIHDNFGTGIITYDKVGGAPEEATYAHHNLYIGDCEIVHNHSGSGIVLSGVDHALVEFCRADGNNGKGGGVGIWAYSARDVTFRHCIASATNSNNGGDGGGFDLDGACLNCRVQSCLSYGNDGPGYMHCDYPTATKTGNNIIEGSVSVNDGRKPRGSEGGFGFCTWGSGLDDCVIADNVTIVTDPEPPGGPHGVYWVGYIHSDSDKGQHLTAAVFRNNIAMIAGANVDYVTDDFPGSAPANVKFEGNVFRSASGLSPAFFLGKTHYSTIDQWRAATGQSSAHAGTPAQRAAAADLGPDLAESLTKITDPRELPKIPLFQALSKLIKDRP